MKQDMVAEFIEFMEKHKLISGTIDDGRGQKIKLKRNKHGFLTLTATQDKFIGDEDGTIPLNELFPLAISNEDDDVGGE